MDPLRIVIILGVMCCAVKPAKSTVEKYTIWKTAETENPEAKTCSMSRGTCTVECAPQEECTCGEGYKAFDQRCAKNSFHSQNCNADPVTGNCKGTCANNMCTCETGLIAEGHNCGSEYFPETCRNGTDCGWNREGTCWNNRCYCKNGLLAMDGKCRRTRFPVEDCNAEKCPPPAICMDKDCVCGPGYFNMDFQLSMLKGCFQYRHHQPSCKASGSDMNCFGKCGDDNTCICRDGNAAVKYKCEPLDYFRYDLQLPCSDGSGDCVDAVCVDKNATGQCICHPGSRVSMSSRQCLMNYFSIQSVDPTQCSQDDICCGFNGRCNREDGVCVCQSDYVANRNRCVMTSATASGCKENSENCPSATGTCDTTTGSCHCKAGFFTEDGKTCVTHSFKPASCNDGDACGDNGKCSNSTCVCNLGFIVKDEKCVEGQERESPNCKKTSQKTPTDGTRKTAGPDAEFKPSGDATRTTISLWTALLIAMLSLTLLLF